MISASPLRDHVHCCFEQVGSKGWRRKNPLSGGMILPSIRPTLLDAMVDHATVSPLDLHRVRLRIAAKRISAMSCDRP
jgi:hypothetical protein